MNIEAEVLGVSTALDAALVTNDAGVFADFMTKDWVYIDPNGATTRTDVFDWDRIREAGGPHDAPDRTASRRLAW